MLWCQPHSIAYFKFFFFKNLTTNCYIGTERGFNSRKCTLGSRCETCTINLAKCCKIFLSIVICWCFCFRSDLHRVWTATGPGAADETERTKPLRGTAAWVLYDGHALCGCRPRQDVCGILGQQLVGVRGRRAVLVPDVVESVLRRVRPGVAAASPRPGCRPRGRPHDRGGCGRWRGRLSGVPRALRPTGGRRRGWAGRSADGRLPEPLGLRLRQARRPSAPAAGRRTANNLRRVSARRPAVFGRRPAAQNGRSTSDRWRF